MKTIKFSTLIALTFSCGLTAAANAGQTFTLKGDTSAGARSQSVGAHASVPFDKHYYELTDSQRELYRARFDSISATQVPPFPKNGLQSVYGPLMDANERGVTGTLKLNVEVNERGQISNLTVIDAPSSHLATASAKALRNTKFDPGYCAGQPCKMTFPVQVTYR